MSEHKTAVPRPSTSSIQGFTGTWIDPFNFTPDMLKLEDIAHSLAEIPRYGGFLRRCGRDKKRTWVVAQHSLVVSAICPEPYKFAALHHDDPDILLGDLAAPIKYHPKLAGFREVELDFKAMFAAALGHEFPLPSCVKHADLIVRWAEADLFHYGTAHWGDAERTEADEPEVGYAKVLINGIVDIDPERLFLAQHRLLKGEDIHAQSSHQPEEQTQ